MPTLPQSVDSDLYWQDLYQRPLSFWQPALDEIAGHHGVPTGKTNGGAWTRAGLGRNIVFLNSSTVIKLGPPHWPGEMVREATALQFIDGRLPIKTPTFIATGSHDGWDYLVEERLPGIILRDIWKDLDAGTRSKLAFQHGELMAALHDLPADEAPQLLAFDWDGMLARQLESYAEEMRTSGMEAHLIDQVEPYLASTPWQIEAGQASLLHGDLNHLNFMMTETEGEWQITGMIDWGDVKIGPPSHEFISPGVHMYRGNPNELRHWYLGYQLQEKRWGVEHQHVIMMRAMLYYAENFAKQISYVPGAETCHDWPTIASLFWRMDLPDA